MSSTTNTLSDLAPQGARLGWRPYGIGCRDCHGIIQDGTGIMSDGQHGNSGYALCDVCWIERGNEWQGGKWGQPTPANRQGFTPVIDAPCFSCGCSGTDTPIHKHRLVDVGEQLLCRPCYVAQYQSGNAHLD